MVNLNKSELTEGIRDDLLDIINMILSDPNLAPSMNMVIDKLPSKKRLDVIELLRSRSSNVDSVKLGYRNFSFSINGFEIVILLASLITSVLQLPNVGLRTANLLRSKFKLGHESQLRLVRGIDLFTNIAPKVMGGLVAINNIIETETSKSVDNVLKGVGKDAWKNPFKYRDWLATFNSLYRNRGTRKYLIKAINELDNPWDKGKAKLILKLLGHHINFSEYENFARIFISRTRNSFGGSDNLEYGDQHITPGDIARIVAHIVINMLANPGVSMVIGNILKRTLSLSTLNQLLISSGISTGATIGKLTLDRIQKIKDATYGVI